MGSPELSLDCGFSSKNWVPRTIGEIFGEVSKIYGVSEKISKLGDYVNRFEDEMKKIDAFKRELPLCMLLLNDAIVTMKDELIQCKKSNPEPVLEEFIPLKNSSTDDKDEKVENTKEKDIINNNDKMNWMSSVQLWNPDSLHPCPNTDSSNNEPSIKLDNSKKRTAEEIDRSVPVMDGLFPNGKNRTMKRAFVPFKGCDELPGVPELSLSMPVIKNSTDEIYSSGFMSKTSCSKSGSSSATNDQSNSKQTSRKQRRCWSDELHHRFISALQHLGGPLAATPKQIRELMQVDGLTNDEVKSHLQKYRIHTQKGTKNTSITRPQDLFMSQDQSGESSKPSNSQSGSPPGPLHLTESSRWNSDDSVEDEDDEKTENQSWKSHNDV